jgi:hypothetical protein
MWRSHFHRTSRQEEKIALCSVISTVLDPHRMPSQSVRSCRGAVEFVRETVPLMFFFGVCGGASSAVVLISVSAGIKPATFLV